MEAGYYGRLVGNVGRATPGRCTGTKGRQRRPSTQADLPIQLLPKAQRQDLIAHLGPVRLLGLGTGMGWGLRSNPSPARVHDTELLVLGTGAEACAIQIPVETEDLVHVPVQGQLRGSLFDVP